MKIKLGQKKKHKDIGIINNGIIALNGEKIIYVGEGNLHLIVVDEDTIVLSGVGKTVTPG